MEKISAEGKDESHIKAADQGVECSLVVVVVVVDELWSSGTVT